MSVPILGRVAALVGVCLLVVILGPSASAQDVVASPPGYGFLEVFDALGALPPAALGLLAAGVAAIVIAVLRVRSRTRAA